MKKIFNFIYYILIGAMVVGVMGGYLNFLDDRDSKMFEYYEQSTISR